MVVPGDLVVFALDPTIPEYGPVLAVLASTLEASGIERGNMTVLSSSRGPAAAQQPVPSGIGLVVHDPNDRGQIAYLATTKQGRRIYLNRLLADADLVIPVGRIGYDARLGYRGPWSVLFPEMSDPDTIQAFRGEFRDDDEGSPRHRAGSGLEESFEVSWLLGTPFHLGLVPGGSGLVEVVAGRDTSVREQGIAALEQHWMFQTDSRRAGRRRHWPPGSGRQPGESRGRTGDRLPVGPARRQDRRAVVRDRRHRPLAPQLDRRR